MKTNVLLISESEGYFYNDPWVSGSVTFGDDDVGLEVGGL